MTASSTTRIGDVPQAWRTLQLRDGATLGAGESPSYVTNGDGEVPVLGANGDIGRTGRSNAANVIAVGRVGASGSVRRIREPVWLSDNVLWVDPTPDIWDIDYLFHLLSACRLPRLASKTAQPLLTQTELGTLRLPSPPLPEQRAIAAVLDAIDEAIERTEAVIEATERLRRSLLHDLLTRGVPGWHSEWKQVPGLGTIPACWDVVRLGDVCEVTSGFAMSPARVPKDSPRPYLTVANVQMDSVSLEDVRYMELTSAEYASRSLQAGDMVMVEGHAQVSQLGRAALIPTEAEGYTFQNHLFRVRLSALGDLAYVSLWVNGPRGRKYFAAFGGTTSGLNTVSARNVRLLPLAWPSKEEQRRIAGVVQQVAAAADGERTALAKLKGMKAALADGLLRGNVRVAI